LRGRMRSAAAIRGDDPAPEGDAGAAGEAVGPGFPARAPAPGASSAQAARSPRSTSASSVADVRRAISLDKGTVMRRLTLRPGLGWVNIARGAAAVAGPRPGAGRRYQGLRAPLASAAITEK